MYQVNFLDKLFNFITSLFTFPFSNSESFSEHYENNNLITQIENSLNPNNFKTEYAKVIKEKLANQEVLQAIQKSMESKKTILGALLYEKNSQDLFDTIYPDITEADNQKIYKILKRHGHTPSPHRADDFASVNSYDTYSSLSDYESDYDSDQADTGPTDTYAILASNNNFFPDTKKGVELFFKINRMLLQGRTGDIGEMNKAIKALKLEAPNYNLEKNLADHNEETLSDVTQRFNDLGVSDNTPSR